MLSFFRNYTTATERHKAAQRCVCRLCRSAVVVKWQQYHFNILIFSQIFIICTNNGYIQNNYLRQLSITINYYL